MAEEWQHCMIGVGETGRTLEPSRDFEIVEAKISLTTPDTDPVVIDLDFRARIRARPRIPDRLINGQILYWLAERFQLNDRRRGDPGPPPPKPTA